MNELVRWRRVVLMQSLAKLPRATMVPKIGKIKFTGCPYSDHCAQPEAHEYELMSWTWTCRGDLRA